MILGKNRFKSKGFLSKPFLFPVLVLITSFIAGDYILALWTGMTYISIANPSKEHFIKALHLNSSNPDPFYRLAFFYQSDIQHLDLEESLHYLTKAIERNPLEQGYWLLLAKTLLRKGQKEASEKSLEKAIKVFPASYRGRWVVGNLFLLHHSIEMALPHFSYILTHYPNEGGFVYDVLHKMINDTDFILERAIPREPSSMNQYMTYLYSTGDKEWVKKAWEKKASYGMKSDRAETVRYIEFFIAHGELSEAFQIWKDRLDEEGFSIPSDGNLITNGGFEKEEILGGGFDWKIGKVSGAAIAFDPSVAFEGRRSLKITFNGKENVDFHHVSQFVPLKSDTEYILQASLRTQSVTTKSGLKIGISGVGSPFHFESESMTGDNNWRELIISFRTPTQSQGGIIQLRRNMTAKFDRFISGTVWIDNVRLTEVNKQ